ncbi:MAG: anaerobic ribonucleoside-triphosphate reductase activating protein [Clostridiales bacterium]|nr:anaerobic ribonucleoside-triphosphate reductase activating protein [Clostridiales bacterium]
MNYAEIKYFDIANGPGVRTSLFVSGCTHCCEGCFNKVAWDFRYGRSFDANTCDEVIKSCEPYYIAGLTLLGGEPMEPENQTAVLGIAESFKKAYPQKTIWCYSGYTYEQLTGKENSRAGTELAEKILSYVDVLVDGEFEKDKRDITLRFRGSSNQRLIDVKKTREQGGIVLWRDDPVFETHVME